MKTKRHIISALTLIVFGLLYLGSAATPTFEANVKTYVSPSLNSSEITSVAIFSLRNAFTQTSSLGIGDLNEINRLFQTSFIEKNRKTTLVNAYSATELLNKGKLVDDYSKFVTVYTQTGIPNTETLKKIGNELKVNGVIQGFIENVIQNDGLMGIREGETRIVFKYVMFSTISGEVLWEVTCVTSAKSGTNFLGGTTKEVTAPPVSEAMKNMKSKIDAAMLTL